MKIKALSLWQPWATWIAEGRKTIETRMWKTDYRGLLLICASKTFDHAAQPGGGCLLPTNFPLGVAVCVADLVDCRRMTRADESAAMCPCQDGRYAWVLANVRKIEPFAVKGHQKLWDQEIPEGIMAKKPKGEAPQPPAGEPEKKPGASEGTIREITASEHLAKIKEARVRVVKHRKDVDDARESLKMQKEMLAVAVENLMQTIGGEGEMPLFNFQIVDARTGDVLEPSAVEALLADREFLEAVRDTDAMFDSVNHGGRSFVLDQALRDRCAANLKAMDGEKPD